MYLKSLTLKGFKSFAQPTTFAFETGRHLHRRAERLRQVERRRRPRLGDGRAGREDPPRRQDGGRHLRRHRRRAARSAAPRCSLTIDNSDGALPIEYTEVTISRTLFRNGASEYAINGDDVPPARRAGAAQRLRASAARCTSSSARASSTRCCRRRPRTAAASSRRPPASSSTAAAKRRPSASSRRCRRTSPGSATSPARSGAS